MLSATCINSGILFRHLQSKNMLKLILVSWHSLASIPTKMCHHFLLFWLGFLQCADWGFNIPQTHFLLYDTPKVSLSHSLTQGEGQQKNRNLNFHTFYFYCSVLFSLLVTFGQAYLFIMQVSPWALADISVWNSRMLKFKVGLVKN